MMKNRGIDALVNDCLIGPVLTMVSHPFHTDILFKVLCSRGNNNADGSLYTQPLPRDEITDIQTSRAQHSSRISALS